MRSFPGPPPGLRRALYSSAGEGYEALKIIPGRGVNYIPTDIGVGRRN